ALFFEWLSRRPACAGGFLRPPLQHRSVTAGKDGPGQLHECSVSRRFFLLASSLMVLMTEAASRGAWAQSHSSPLPAPEARRNFLACPIVQDTPTVPCWLAEYHGELYFLGIQTDSAGWSPPYLGHRVLVEGALAGGPRICGGIPLTSKYPASPIPSGKANGRPLPNPPVVSVMRELDSSCNELRAADPQFQIEGRRGPGPNVPSAGRSEEHTSEL